MEQRLVTDSDISFLENLNVHHHPCSLCNLDTSTKEKVAHMLENVNLQLLVYQDLAGLYHAILHSRIMAAKTMLYFQESRTLVWLFQIAHRLNEQNMHHGNIVKMLTGDILSER